MQRVSPSSKPHSSLFLTSRAFFNMPSDSEAIALSRFAKLAHTECPFRVSWKELVYDVGELESSQQGQSKRSFKLVDEASNWIACLAIGHCATHPALQDLREVIVFYAYGRSGSSRGQGAIFLFSTSAIIGTKLQHRMGRSGSEIEIG